MRVKRIVSNIAVSDMAAVRFFYEALLGLDPAMDLGWIATLTSDETMRTQVSLMTEGGSGTPVPALSIEVDDVDKAHKRMREAGVTIEYGPVDEPWGVRRFYVRDPMGTLINILAHR
ncbi:MAG: glyoxalase [Rhizobiales bacterium 62-17]|nr:VOC family protein [Hyphomicrobiales bacterium]OJY05901.1 MAG: glyoxalase [Rhizobiales bacterium 62-17]